MTETRRHLLRCLNIAVLAAVSVLVAPLARADEEKDAAAGRALAEKVCSPCHQVSTPAGSSFADIAEGAYGTPGSLGNFLRSTHSSVSHPNAMPAPGLTQQQIDEIAAYLATLRKGK